MTLIYTFLGIISLAIGGLVYLCFRPDYLIMFDWAKILGMEYYLNDLRGYSNSFDVYLPDWTIYSAPNGLWVFSFSMFMLSVWGYNLSSLAISWVLILLGISIVSEMMQFFRIIPGTFDPVDIAAYIIGFLPIWFIGLSQVADF